MTMPHASRQRTAAPFASVGEDLRVEAARDEVLAVVTDLGAAPRSPWGREIDVVERVARDLVTVRVEHIERAHDMNPLDPVRPVFA